MNTIHRDGLLAGFSVQLLQKYASGLPPALRVQATGPGDHRRMKLESWVNKLSAAGQRRGSGLGNGI
jgi:hypothetical protein